MKKIAIKCLGADLKKYLLELIDDDNTRKIIEDIPTCAANQMVEFDTKKRKKASEYSKFIGGCIKDLRSKDEHSKVPELMKKCAELWKNKSK